jgi:predicted transcriptional regulator
MKSKVVLISVKPKYVSLIVNGSKKYELRRKCPKIQSGDSVLVYESSPTMCLVGAFIVGTVLYKSPESLWRHIGKESGVSRSEFLKYFSGCEIGSAIEIAKYWPLETKVSLVQLREYANLDPPQSFRYLCEEVTNKILAGNGGVLMNRREEERWNQAVGEVEF